MKKQLFSLIALGLLFATASANAQTINVKANIPFDFVVNKQIMPRGEYTVQSIGTQGNGALLIRSMDSRAVSTVVGHSCESYRAPGISKLVFHHYGERYFLAQLWTSGNSSGQEFPVSKTEKQLAQVATADDVVIAALR